MSNYVNDLNDLITAKSEIKNIIQNTLNENPSEVFSYYPSYIARIAANAGADEETINSYISAYLGAYNFIDQDTLSANSYITLQDIPSVDLSSYVTYDFLSSQSYTTTSDVDLTVENATILDVNAGGGDTINTDWKDVLEESGLITPAVGQDEQGYDIMDIHQHIDTTVETWLNLSSYVTQAQISNAGYLTSIPNTYPTYTAIENMAYITMADVSACGYVTASDIPSVVVPAIDENLIPKETATYTLGDSSYYYAYTYTNSLVLGTHTIKNNSTQSFIININGNDRYAFGNTGFFPMATNRTLGQNTNSGKWLSTYTAYLYCDIDGVLTDIGYYLSYNLSGVETLLANI